MAAYLAQKAVPFAVMIILECTDVGASILQGMSSFVSVVYFNALGTLLLLPYTIFCRRTMASCNPRECGSTCQFVLFVLALITGLIVLVVGLMMNSKYSPRSHQQSLVIRLNSFSVSGLNVSSNSIPGANWDAKLLFGNRHTGFEILIESFETFVYYNRQDALSCAEVEPIHLGPRRQRLVEIRFDAAGCGGGEQPFVEDRLVKQVKRDGNNGTLHLGLMLNLQVSYKKGPWSWVYEVKPRCSDLDVLFLTDTGAGMMSGDRPRLCAVPPLK